MLAYPDAVDMGFYFSFGSQIKDMNVSQKRGARWKCFVLNPANDDRVLLIPVRLFSLSVPVYRL